MPICPSGHTSGSDDFCDTCGDLIPGAPRQRLGDAENSAPPPEAEPAEECPVCGAPRSGRFCEVDAYDFETGAASRTAAPVPPQPPRPPSEGGAWRAVISADRAYYQSVIELGGPDAATIAFPPYCPERTVALSGEQIRIGRRSASRGIEPEIDLSGPPEDPGVSHVHAVLLGQPDGTWALVDPGSMNGTTLNGGGKLLDVNVPVPVGDGDRVHVGAWTTITLERSSP
ncbi:FHA domain-containing protein [Actinomadura sp. 9N407]|uniref:FHA domain-containing protein n=1 Tax=Actinomadura sp. 9N407 TaxID=3375154 RepID=UPI0037B82129